MAFYKIPSLKKSVLSFFLLAALLSVPRYGQAQTDPLVQARQLTETKEYDKALELYKKLYSQTPTDADIYHDYFSFLLTTKNYKEAEKLVSDQMRLRNQSPLLMIDLGQVYWKSKKEKKAAEQFDKAIQYINGDDIVTTQMANTFMNIGNDEYAILTFERAQELLRNPFIYGSQLARLYAKKGNIEKAVDALLNAAPGQMGGVDDMKATMLDMLGSDAQKQQVAQKVIVKRINAQPENPYFAEILTWLFTQKGDWEGALMQIQAIDERNKETGQRLLDFEREAVRQSQYDIAIKALDAIAEKGKENPLYATAKAEQLSVRLDQLEHNPTINKGDATQLAKYYDQFLNEFPQYYTTETVRDYATLEAQYNHNPEKGIELLTKASTSPNARKDFAGQCKLQMGDYLIITGKIWDASLIYSQVDKAFKEDILGEEARFRNAKLAYYRGDFEWAQGQLSVLKASTSELIANDALYLSVLITENVTPDSNMVPLERFAYADLLLFQNKDSEAEALLDSVSKAYPKHPLNDDILLLRSKIAMKHKEYAKALEFLKEIYLQYGKDVLGDDAVYKTAEIYEQNLHQGIQAKTFYEKLILDYPGSTYAQGARQRLQALQSMP